MIYNKQINLLAN